MKKSNIMLILLTALLLQSCGNPPKVDKQIPVSQDINVEAEVTPTPSPTVSPTTAPTPEATPTPLPTPSPTPEVKATPTPTPEVKPAVEKYGWSFKINKEHKPTIIPKKSEDLLKKYNGLYIGDTNRKAVYLTFDEGYENGYTSQILDTLKENNVKSIFFVTGPYLKKNPDLVKRMIDEGHKIGNHSLTHPSFPEISEEAMLKEVEEVHNMAKSDFGVEFEYFRFPKGEFNENTLKFINSYGYKSVFWSYAYLDYDVNNQKGADYAYEKVMDNLHNGEIILLHAVSKDNTEALDRIIKDIIAQGYEILPFDL